MKIDATHLDIIRHLRDGRKSFRKIADALSLSENTVRTRVGRLMARGIMVVTALVDPERVPYIEPVFIGVKLTTTNIVRKAKEFSGLRGVISASAVTGRYDLILQVLFTKDYTLQNFYVEQVSRVEEVQSLETFVIFKSYNLKVPYIH